MKKDNLGRLPEDWEQLLERALKEEVPKEVI
jgi:hypothetical protein